MLSGSRGTAEGSSSTSPWAVSATSGDLASAAPASGRRDSSIFRFDVVDEGIGISPQQASRLFRPFEQANVGVARTYGGTGLGLAISKNLVEMLGGEIDLDSREGEGSTFGFTIRCPAKAETSEPGPAQAAA